MSPWQIRRVGGGAQALSRADSWALTESGLAVPVGAPSGFPDASNTGHTNAPGYPGSLTAGPATIASNTTYSYKEFNGCDIGLVGSPVTNVTFYGCRFHSNWIDGWNIAIAGDNILLDYCTVEPDTATQGTLPYNQGYQYGIKQNTTLSGKNFTVDHCNFRGFGNAIEFAYSSQAKPVIVRNSYIHHARDDGGVDHTDGVQSNNANCSYVVIDHNTIVSIGNTQGIALQSEAADPGYDHITITNNYVAGWGYTVAIGENETGDTNIVFTDNVFGTDIAPSQGSWLYDDDTWTVANTHTWRRNKVAVKPYPSQSSWNYPTPSDDGKYVHPNMTISTTDYAL